MKGSSAFIVNLIRFSAVEEEENNQSLHDESKLLNTYGMPGAAHLTDAEVISVKMFRRLETQDLHPDEADIALRYIANWHPPLVSIR